MGEYLKVNISDKNYIGKIDYGDKILPFSRSELIFAHIKSKKTLANGEEVKTVYDLGLSFDGIVSYLPGDTIGILPKNDSMEVQEILKRLNIVDIADNECSISILENTTKKKPIIPKHLLVNCSLRHLFLNCIDLRMPPKKMFLKSLINHTSDTSEVEFLTLITTPSGSKQYTEFISEKGRTLLKLLNNLPSCQPPIELILEHSTVLQPRPYSISSSPLTQELHITFFVQTNDDGSRGVCTGWLEDIINRGDSNEIVPFYFRVANDFRISNDISIPMVMIGTGTGIAPFHGFLQHRRHLKNEASTIGETWLFHGCRYTERDALYKQEISEMLECGILSKYYLCASRDQNEKCYVQKKLQEVGEQFVNYITRKDALVFICGDPKTMVKDVKATILDLLMTHGSMSNDEAMDYYSNLQKNKKILIDTWL